MYNSAQDFLDDIDLVAENAIAYNSDLQYETNKIITHRARALQDFSYALVKAEMDTDFEDNCKEIVERRKKLTKKLKESPESFEQNTSGTTAVPKKKKAPRRKVSNWAKGLDTSRSKRISARKKAEEEEEQDGENNEEAEPMEEENGVEENGVHENEEDAEDQQVQESPSSRSTRNGGALNNGDLELVPKTGVRVDKQRLAQIHKDLVKMTEGYPVERLERIYCILIEVVQDFVFKTDRSTLPDKMQRKIAEIKAAKYPRD